MKSPTSNRHVLVAIGQFGPSRLPTEFIANYGSIDQEFSGRALDYKDRDILSGGVELLAVTPTKMTFPIRLLS